MEGLACPGCGQIDQAQRVSSIVEVGTSTGAYSGTGVGLGYAALGHHSGGPVLTINFSVPLPVIEEWVQSVEELDAEIRAQEEGEAAADEGTDLDRRGDT